MEKQSGNRMALEVGKEFDAGKTSPSLLGTVSDCVDCRLSSSCGRCIPVFPPTRRGEEDGSSKEVPPLVQVLAAARGEAEEESRVLLQPCFRMLELRLRGSPARARLRTAKEAKGLLHLGDKDGENLVVGLHGDVLQFLKEELD